MVSQWQMLMGDAGDCSEPSGEIKSECTGTPFGGLMKTIKKVYPDPDISVSTLELSFRGRAGLDV